jgi:hypothetical protein
MSKPVNTASAVSRTLNEAGVPKASAYRTFGRERDGFEVRKATPYGPQDEIASVSVTAMYEAGRVMCERVIEVLRAAGYTVREPKNNGLGGTYRVTVVEEHDGGPTEEEYRAALETHWAAKAARASGEADEEFDPADAYEADDPKRWALS